MLIKSCVLLCAVLFAQDDLSEWATTGQPQIEATATTSQEARSGFHAAIVKAIKSARQSGDLTVRQAVKLRVCMLSPALRDHAETLAVVQMVASGENPELIPRTPAGTVDRAAIDWDGLIVFLERLLPLILQLIELFGGSA